MHLTRVVCLCVLLIVSAAASVCADVQVKLKVQEPAGVARSAGAITSGVPFARGAVKDVGKLAVSIAGKPVPAQFTTLAKWDDGSVSWALLDAQAAVPANGLSELLVSDSGNNPKPANPVEVKQAGDDVTVSTGSLRFAVGKKSGNIMQSLSVDGQDRLTPGSRGLVLHKAGGGEVVAAPPTNITIEQAGPMRAVVCVRGIFPGVHNGLVGYTVRLTALAGAKHVKLHVWLENHGASGHFLPTDFNRRDVETTDNFEWFAFDGLSLELGLGLGEKLTATCEDIESADGLKVLQLCLHSKTKKMGTSEGPFYTFDDFEYTMTAGGKELKKGLRTDGVMAITGPTGSLTAAVRDFWQNYEKAIELDGKTLKVWLWPTEGRWPRPFYWLTYGTEKTLTKAINADGYLLPGSVRKGHELILDFSGRDAKAASADLCKPLMALASAEYYASTEAGPGLFAPPQVRTGDRDCDSKLDSWTRMIRSVADPSSPAGLFKAREHSDYFQLSQPVSSYWFGWLDFGDLSVPGAGQVGLHYDWPRIALLGAMRTGDVAFIDLATSMTRHRIEVDQFWSQREHVPFRGLQRRAGTSPTYHCSALYSPIGPDSQWLAGTVLYYMLTGEPMALEAINNSAAGLKESWAWLEKNKPYWNPAGDTAANALAIESYCAMYKLTADRAWLDAALGVFNRYIVPRAKELGPFLHRPNDQIRGQEYVQEDMKYCYSIATFCELHQLTGDEAVLKLLSDGCQKEFPDSFFGASLFLADLYAYIGYKTGDSDLLDKAVEAFAASFPESKCPPVFLPGNSTWSRTSAMTLRTGHLLQYAFWKSGKK